jgi:peptide chain release factor subunit 1
LKEQEGVLGEIVRHTKRGGASAFPGRRGGIAGQTRYTEEVIDRNMKSSVDFAVHFFEENRVRRILIGGTDDNVALFKSLLPKSWQSLVVGTFPMSMSASHPEVQARAIEAGAQSMKRREDLIIDTTITAAAKLGNGVIGLDDTLRALHEGRVQTLLISSGYRDPGYQCSVCGFLAGHISEGCPFCGNKLEEISDAIELAVRKVIKSGGEVEVIHQHTAFDKAGRIGALLRY